ncbi:MAG: hypothetical protein FWC15_05145 [Fibromonadales bacterium]|nr:hypothetical protein [Fibromonadales bacterium]
MAGPLAFALAPVLAKFAGWLATFLGSWLMMGIFGFLAEALPRMLGLGQGLISWGFGVAASAAFSAFQSAMSIAGVEVPDFRQLLSGLPPSVLWAGSAMRVHRIVFILVSILIVKMLRKVMEGVVSAASRGVAGSLMSGGK